MPIRVLLAALLATQLVACAQNDGVTNDAVERLNEQLQRIDERLQRLEDKAAIHDLIQEYAVRLTSRDFDGYVELFAPDGVWQNGDIVKNGREEIKAMLVDMFPNTTPDYVNTSSYMFVSNIQVQVDGDRARAKSRQTSIIRGADGSPVPVLAGMYEDEFVRLNGEWKFRHRNDITFIPTQEEWAK